MPLPLARLSTESIDLGTAPAESLAPSELEAPRALQIWHLASLDAPTVAVVWSLAFAWGADVRLPAWVTLLLALGTWAVYIGDRLLDVRSALRSNRLDTLRERHFFHWRHRRALLPLAVAAATAATFIILTLMPVMNRERGSLLGLAALAYFSGVHLPHRPRWLAPLCTKEFLVGVIFTAGCVLPTLSRLQLSAVRIGPIAEAFTFFAALAWLNCFAIAHWESAQPRSIRTPALTIAALGLVLALACAATSPRSAALIGAGSASALLLATFDRARFRLSPLTLRIAADLVLLTPLLLLVR